MSFTSKIRVAVAVAALSGATFATSTLTATPAEAYSRGFLRIGIVRPVFGFYRAPLLLLPRLIVPVATVATIAVVPTCAIYKHRAIVFNSTYWLDRYNDCMGY